MVYREFFCSMFAKRVQIISCVKNQEYIFKPSDALNFSIKDFCMYIRVLTLPSRILHLPFNEFLLKSLLNHFHGFCIQREKHLG